ncbi:MAG: hypothetical protein HUU41_20325 [Bryobacteraceae bacterium]|nr:hypothetical protein [Bryobacterales bacterium]MEB2362299.1 hypothetical protein [Bryobacterales bacterium]NUN03460.1 hypothetical protein [Bryobacteraceae bacterium]
MLQPLIFGERGCAALVAFEERMWWLQECTDDSDPLVRALDNLRPGEYKSAHMLDAVHEALNTG